MLRMRVNEEGDGLHPSELIVSVDIADGSKELLPVSRKSVEDGMIEIGYPIGKRNGAYLVELPRETYTGTWRVWVSAQLLKGEGM